MKLELPSLNKDQIIKFMQNQFIIFLIVGILGIILTYKQYSPIITILVLGLLLVYSYFVHIFMHILPGNFLNLHLLFHHNQNKNASYLQSIITWIAEVITNILMFASFYLIKNILNLKFISNTIIFYYSVIYITIHNINYTIFHISENHSLHHTTETKNFGPDLCDHLFKTNYNNNFENYSHILPNIFFAFLLTYYLFKPNNLIIYRYIKIIFIIYAIILILYKILKYYD